MVDLSKLFDSYSRQARLFPGLLTLFPIILTAIALFPRLVTSSWGATLVTVGTSCGLLYGLSVLSRSRGKAVEKRLLAEWGGWPTTIWLRHREEHLPPPVLARYHVFFAKHVPLFVAPNAEQERADPKAADGMYASAVKWLQERCRGKAFPLVEKENAEYGFRRNLRGLKPIGVTACLVALLISALAIVWRYDPVIPAISSVSMPSLFKALAAIKPAAVGAVCVDLAALVAWFAIVRDNWVRDAGDQFARSLLACCDTLDVPSTAKPSAAENALERRRVRKRKRARRGQEGIDDFGHHDEGAPSFCNSWTEEQQPTLGAFTRRRELRKVRFVTTVLVESSVTTPARKRASNP